MTERLLTIVFTDVEGSTALRSAKGEAEAQRTLLAMMAVFVDNIYREGLDH